MALFLPRRDGRTQRVAADRGILGRPRDEFFKCEPRNPACLTVAP